MVSYFYLTLPHLLQNSSINFNQLDISYIAFEAIIGFLTLLTSLIVLIIFYCERHRFNEVRHYYVVSLTFSDFLFVLIGIPLYVGVSLGWPMNKLGCLGELSVLISAGLVSVLTIVMASVDKYWAVLHPFHYLSNATYKVAKWMIALTWILGIILGSLPAFGWNRMVLEKLTFDKCFYMSVIPKSYMIFVLGGIIVPSCLILIYIYTAIYYVYKRAILAPGTSILPQGTIKRREPPSESSQLLSRSISYGSTDPDHHSNSRGTGCLLFSTVFTFVICWLPLYIIDVLYATVPTFHINEHLKHFLITLRHINALVLPYLYAYHLIGFKDALKKRCIMIWKRGGECECA